MSAGSLGANTLGVLAGCVLFGALAGAVGTFVLARRRALVADVAGHAALPGIALAFLAGEALGLGGRTPWLRSLDTVPATWSTIGIAREYCIRSGPIRPTVPVTSPSA